MKKLIAIVSFFAFAISANAQFSNGVDSTLVPVDSSKTQINIALKAEQHYLIIDFLPDVKSPRIADYVKQVVKQTDTVYNPSKMISVKSESALIPEVYELLSVQREGVTAQPNQDMKTALLPQLPGFTWIAKEIQRIDAQNAQLRQQRTMRGFEYCKNLKQ